MWAYNSNFYLNLDNFGINLLHVCVFRLTKIIMQWKSVHILMIEYFVHVSFNIYSAIPEFMKIDICDHFMVLNFCHNYIIKAQPWISFRIYKCIIPHICGDIYEYPIKLHLTAYEKHTNQFTEENKF